MDQITKFIVEKVLGIQWIDGKPLPEILLTGLITRLQHPQQPDLTVQTYGDLFKLFAVGMLYALLFELIFRLIVAFKNPQDIGDHGREWLFSAVMLLGFSPFIPAFILGTQKIISLTGTWLGTALLGDLTPEQLVAILSQSSGNGAADVALVILRLIFGAILFLWVNFVPVLIWAAPIALIVGVCVRFIPAVGDVVLYICLAIVIYGVASNGVIMFILGLGLTAVQAVSPNTGGDSAFGKAFLIVTVMLAAVVVLLFTLKKTFGHIKQSVKGAVKVINSLKGRFQRSGGGGTSGGGSGRAQDRKVASRLVDKAKGDSATGRQTIATPQRKSSTARRIAHGALNVASVAYPEAAPALQAAKRIPLPQRSPRAAAASGSAAPNPARRQVAPRSTSSPASSAKVPTQNQGGSASRPTTSPPPRRVVKAQPPRTPPPNVRVSSPKKTPGKDK